ncbi:MAG: aminodeoxychorismate lyase [Lysobacterales bacterium CG17_big_fil_post_rev_8_21_14_2_50_64_11]|nr:MAG: aminodeoxychorismate lyase [Xanthomonadales bacterium CG17_big_fil_post_rev_8_21_14_2_50_64_11]PIX61114.1 MAG: aminodeoxychorismate lyase [Xanthomonadales bacterium CG_4_10_14_3_um_filter_64_11]
MSVAIVLAEQASVRADDRGLNYGDGVFETLRIHAGRPLWWDAHWQRLRRGAAVLAIEMPEHDAVVHACAALLAPAADGVLKLLLTRGGGGRGYAPPEPAQPQLLISRHALPPPWPAAGGRVRWSQLRLGIQPLLAGIKHCNRLEQVLARREWSDPDIHESLLCDALGAPTCAVSGNLFVLRDGVWLTPLLDRAGVAGLCRQWLLAQGIGHEQRLCVADVEQADAVFLCNAVRGILPVCAVGERQMALPPQLQVVMQALAAAEPAFARTR